MFGNLKDGERQIIHFQPEPCEEGDIVQFRLVYEGPLPSGSSKHPRKEEKHAIRRAIHSQLAQLWANDSLLKHWDRREIQRIADDNAKFGYRFVPLVHEAYGLACSLDILFLRRDEPGRAVSEGGDLDNRLKVLFDALRMPKYQSDVTGFTPQPGEDPFFCLLEDDALITAVSITTDRILLPLEAGDYFNNVLLVIHVTTKVTITSGARLSCGTDESLKLRQVFEQNPASRPQVYATARRR